MKHYLKLVLVCLVAGATTAQIPLFMPQRLSSHAQPTHNYILSEGFENIGFENAGWTGTGYPDATTVGALEGMQYLAMQGGGVQQHLFYADLTPAVDYPELWFAFGVYIGGYPSDNFLPVFVSSSGSGTLSLGIGTATGQLQVTTSGGDSILTTDGLALSQWQYVWIHYKQGSVSNAVVEIGFSVDATRPTSGTKYAGITNGVSTFALHGIDFYSMIAGDPLLGIDKLRVDIADIGSDYP